MRWGAVGTPPPETAETPAEAGEYLVEEMRQVTERIIGIPATRFQGLSAKQLHLDRDMVQDIETQLAEWRSIIGTA